MRGVKAYKALHVNVPVETKKRLEAYCGGMGQSQGSVVDAALREYMNNSSQATLIMQELARIRRGVGRVERNLDVMDAGLSGFLQLWLAYNPPMPEGQKKAAHQSAEERFDQMVTFIKDQLSSNRTFISRVADDDMFSREDIRALLEQEDSQ